MTFLSTIFLVALPLALAPILLHLFDRRRNVTIEWGAMEFLLEAATRRTSARKLKQWLLLLLRALAIAALVMALARPMLPGNWFGGNQRGETILIIDNSMSTQRSSDETTLFAKLIERAQTESESLKRGDSLRLLLASPYPVWVTAGGIQIGSLSPDMLLQQFAEIRPTNGSSDLLAAMMTAIQADSEREIQRRRVVVLTDGQGTDWKMNDRNGWQRFQDVLKSADVPTSLEIIELEASREKSLNLAVNVLKASRLVTGIGQHFTVAAQIRNYSSAESPECRVSWRIDSHELHTADIPSLPGGNAHEAIWRHAFAKPGVYSLSCEIDADDDLAADNRATVVIEAVQEIPVLVVEGAAAQPNLLQDSYLLQAAMGWVNGEAMEQHSVYRPVVISPEQLEEASLAGYRAVIIPNLTTLSKRTIESLKAFAFNGGGVWIAAGPRTDVEMFNEYLFAAGDGLSPVALDGIVSESGLSSSPTITAALRDHPATTELANNQRLDTAEVRVRRRFRFIEPAQHNDVSTLLHLSNGESLAVEKYVGQGRVILMAIPLMIRDWSDLTRSQAYVVMVQDWLSYLTQPQATRYNLLPGDPIAVHVAETEHREAFLRTPHGAEIELSGDMVADGVLFRSSRTILPGDYRLQLGLSGESIPFHVARNSQESDLKLLAPEAKQLLADAIGVSRDLTHSTSAENSRRDPVWPLMLILLIAFMSIELLLSGMISRERFGTSMIAETSGNFVAGSETATMELQRESSAAKSELSFVRPEQRIKSPQMAGTVNSTDTVNLRSFES